MYIQNIVFTHLSNNITADLVPLIWLTWDLWADPFYPLNFTCFLCP